LNQFLDKNIISKLRHLYSIDQNPAYVILHFEFTKQATIYNVKFTLFTYHKVSEKILERHYSLLQVKMIEV